MSMTEAISRIQQIQVTLTQLSAPQPTQSAAAAGARTAASGGSASAFADALAAAAPAPTAVDGKVDGGGATGADLVESAKKYIGVPYVWGGEDATGMDCSGFVQRAFADLGIDMPRLVREQITKGTEIASFADARPGDLISSFNGDHISIYLGNGKAIDAPVPGKHVAIRDAWEMDSNLHKIVRVLPAEQSLTIPGGAGALGAGASGAAGALGAGVGLGGAGGLGTGALGAGGGGSALSNIFAASTAAQAALIGGGQR